MRLHFKFFIFQYIYIYIISKTLLGDFMQQRYALTIISIVAIVAIVWLSFMALNEQTIIPNKVQNGVFGKNVVQDYSGNAYLASTSSSTISALQATAQKLSTQNNNPSSDSNVITKGYIVKFKNPSILIYQEQLNVGYQQPLFSTNAVINSAHISNSIASQVKSYASTIAAEHVSAKSSIGQSLGISISGKILGEYTKTFDGMALDISAQDASKLLANSYVAAVYPNYQVKTSLMDAVPLIGADKVWTMNAAGASCVTAYGSAYGSGMCLTGKGIKIAIIDTGVDYLHPDLGGCFGAGCKVAAGYDFVNKDSDPMDDEGHGTHVAATAAGKGVLKGVAPDATIYAYKVIDNKGSGYVSDIISGIEMAVDPNGDGDTSDHVDVISMSLGGPGDADDAMSSAVDAAVDSGAVAVIAAGNDGPSQKTVGSPGTARNAITVGATYKKDYQGNYWSETNPRVDQITIFSSRGPVLTREGAFTKPDVVAPGAFICAARFDSIFPVGENSYYYPCVDDFHVLMAGTSMATPIVAGSAALIKQAHPDWTPAEIKSTIRTSAKKLGYDMYTEGFGRINVLRAVSQKTPSPVALLRSVTADNNVLNIMMDAKSRNFAKYVISYKKNSESSWNELTESQSAAVENQIYTFDISSLDPGIYDLKLEVYNAQGMKAEDYMFKTFVRCIPGTIVVAADGTGDFNDIQDGLTLVCRNGQVYIKNGIYNINKPLEIYQKNNIRITGQSRDEVILNVMMQAWSGLNIINSNNVVVDGLTFKGSYVSDTYWAEGIRLIGDVGLETYRITLQNLNIIGLGRGIDLHADGPYLSNITVTNSIINETLVPLGRTSSGRVFQDVIDDIFFTNNIVERDQATQYQGGDEGNLAAGQYLLAGGTLGEINNLQIKNNLFINKIGNPGYSCNGYFMVIDPDPLTNKIKNIFIQDNTFNNVDNYCIRKGFLLFYTDNYTFVNNRFIGKYDFNAYIMTAETRIVNTTYSGVGSSVTTDYYEPYIFTVTDSEIMNSTIVSPLSSPDIHMYHNYYKDYTGRDLNNDGFGDTPQIIYDQNHVEVARDLQPRVKQGIVSSSCTDTDGGVNYYVKGSTYGTAYGVAFYNNDSCSSNMLTEYYCSGVQSMSTSYNCGTIGCSNGACNKAVCGNNFCDPTETSTSCPQDCASAYVSALPTTPSYGQTITFTITSSKDADSCLYIDSGSVCKGICAGPTKSCNIVMPNAEFPASLAAGSHTYWADVETRFPLTTITTAKKTIIISPNTYDAVISQNVCTDTCVTKGYKCGSQTVCGQTIDCGSCDTGQSCSSGVCVNNAVVINSPIVVGDRVRVVLSTDCLNARSGPSLSSNVLYCHLAGDQGTVVGGPVSADNYNFWNINYDTYFDGWSADKYLEKIGTTNNVVTVGSNTYDAVAVSQNVCTDTCVTKGYKCGQQMICGTSQSCGTCGQGKTCNDAGQCVNIISNGLVVGDRVRVVLTTDCLNARDAPSLTSNILFCHLAGDQGTIVGGPITSGSYTFWIIDYDNNADGWSADKYLEKIT